MNVSIMNLDGSYEVHSETIDGGPFAVNGDGVTTVSNGMTYRKDKNGCIWESTFTILGPDKVQMESYVDPSHAGPDVYILDEKGNPTKSFVSYKTMLDAKLVDGKVVMSGTIAHGKDTTRFLMKQL